MRICRVRLRRGMARIGVWRIAALAFLAHGMACWLGVVGNIYRRDYSEVNRAFRAAVQRNDIREVQLLLLPDGTGAHRSIIRRQPPDKALLLGSAVGDLGLVRALLQRGADPNCAGIEYCNGFTLDFGITGVTPLMLAAEYDHPAVAGALLAHGARVDAQDMLGETPLMKAASSGATGIMESLLALGAAVDQRDGRGCTALYHGLKGQGSAGKRWIPTRGIEVPRPPGPTAVEILLRRGADVNWRPKEAYGNPIGGWRSVLHWSAEYGDAETVSLLLQAGADVTLRDGEANTALDLARAKNHRDVVRLLERASGADR